MKQIRLFDAAFPSTKSMSAKGENVNLEPKYFEWYRGNDYRPICFFTDSCLHLARETEARVKVAWLLEPHPFRQNAYDFVAENPDDFDYILTYSRVYIERGDKWLFYPYGGSMIHPDRWGIKPKSKLCSIIVSEKNHATGHKLRHEIVREFGGRIDVLGSGYGPYINKYEGLADYQYSIVIQGERLDWCFDEKLIDCFAVGTIPIYWGCPSIHNHFDLWGIEPFVSMNQLDELLSRFLFLHLEKETMKAVDNNFHKAQQYRCAEDWIYEHYPFLFEVE